MTAQVAARLFAVLMGLVALFQAALVVGAPWGRLTQGGQVDGALPASGRALAAVSALLLAVMALGVLARAGEGQLRSAPRRLVTSIAWVAAVYSTAGVALNLMSPSLPERLMWAPVAAVGAFLAWWVIAGTRRSA